ncbi:MAG: hypothetical protein ACOX0J_05635 [Thermoactinomyces vulgaris]
MSGAHRAYQTEMNDLLLSGLVMTLNSWTHGKVAVQLEGHGREEVIDGVDLTGRSDGLRPCIRSCLSKIPKIRTKSFRM